MSARETVVACVRFATAEQQDIGVAHLTATPITALFLCTHVWNIHSKTSYDAA